MRGLARLFRISRRLEFGIMTRGGEVVSRKAHNLEIGGAIPPPAKGGVAQW